jgi:hypothetical protein
MRIVLLFMGVICTGAFGVSCSKSAPGNTMTSDCSGVAKSFSSNVSPIISNSCAISNCHQSGSVNGPGELLTYQEIFNARSDIRSAVLSGVMPQNSSLTPSQINMITCWIDSGAPDN